VHVAHLLLLSMLGSNILLWGTGRLHLHYALHVPPQCVCPSVRSMPIVNTTISLALAERLCDFVYLQLASYLERIISHLFKLLWPQIYQYIQQLNEVNSTVTVINKLHGPQSELLVNNHRGGAGRGVQGSGPPSGDQDDLRDSHKSEVFWGEGWG